MGAFGGELQVLTCTPTISKHSTNMSKPAQVEYPADFDSFDELDETAVVEAC